MITPLPQKPRLSRRNPSIQLCLLALLPVLLTAEMANAALVVGGGAPGGAFTTNATNVYTSAGGDPTVENLPAGVVIADGSPSGTGTFNASGSLSVQSGTYTLNASNTSFVGQGNRTGSATLNISGGTLNINSPNNAFVFANSGGNASGSISGGVFNLSIGAGSPFFFARESGVAQFTITGGLFSTNTTSFTLDTNSQQQGGGPDPSGIITFGAGSGEFRFTSAPTTFDLGVASRSYFNFLSGSGGKLTINGFTQVRFDNLVGQGSIKIDGFAADASRFTYSNVGGLGTYQLVAVPEPSTWVMMTAGAAGLFMVSRRRRKA